jgi:hypothetical protein
LLYPVGQGKHSRLIPVTNKDAPVLIIPSVPAGQFKNELEPGGQYVLFGHGVQIREFVILLNVPNGQVTHEQLFERYVPIGHNVCENV